MKKTAEPATLLREGLAGLALDAALAPPLLAYLAELEKWNAAYNLTAVRNPAEMVTRHLLDSLATLTPLAACLPPGARLLDVGSGAGLPGIPLALARPDLRVAVLDSNGKKARFLRHARRVLALDRLQVIEARIEAHHPLRPYDGVISRAFSALDAFVRATDAVLAHGGWWLAMKGRVDDNPAAGLPAGVHLHRVVPLQVPGLDEARHLVVLSRSAASTSESP